MVSQRKRNYELMLVISPEANEDQVAAMVERVATYVSDHGGNVSEQDNWGLRQLAYPIRKFQEGTYTLTKFELEAENILELDRSLNASEDVLRHLVTKA